MKVFLFLLIVATGFSKIHHHQVKAEADTTNTYEWEETAHFDELLITWNAERPTRGHYEIHVSVDTGEWSPWVLYAVWGESFQSSFKEIQAGIQVYQDGVEPLEGEGKGFKVKVIANDGSDISKLHSLHVSTNFIQSLGYKEIRGLSDSYFINVKGLSQMALTDPRKDRLCSPTSTTAVVRYLSGNQDVDPIEFGENSWDGGFDIFGNWVLNLAEGYQKIMGQSYSCWVERLESFEQIHEALRKEIPTVISVRSPLPGSAISYKSGHLLAVIGYDAETNEVICMDPAFEKDGETIVRYQLDDLMKAWERRKNVAYMFDKTDALF